MVEFSPSDLCLKIGCHSFSDWFFLSSRYSGDLFAFVYIYMFIYMYVNIGVPYSQGIVPRHLKSVK